MKGSLLRRADDKAAGFRDRDEVVIGVGLDQEIAGPDASGVCDEGEEGQAEDANDQGRA